MKLKETKLAEMFEKTKKTILKIGKRNAIIGCSVMLICGAVILNVIAFGGGEEKSGFDYSAAVGMSNTGEDTSAVDNSGDDDNYFAMKAFYRCSNGHLELDYVTGMVIEHSSSLLEKKKREYNFSSNFKCNK